MPLGLKFGFLCVRPSPTQSLKLFCRKATRLVSNVETVKDRLSARCSDNLFPTTIRLSKVQQNLMDKVFIEVILLVGILMSFVFVFCLVLRLISIGKCLFVSVLTDPQMWNGSCSRLIQRLVLHHCRSMFNHVTFCIVPS